MAFLDDDLLTRIAFSLYENKGVFALLVGSGLSRSAEIPTGWEITLDLVRRVALARGVPEQPDWAAWYRKEFSKEPNYSRLLAELSASPDERRSILHSYIEPTEDDRNEGRKIPTEAHKAIARLVAAGYVRVIITTNFDRLIEAALREEGVEPTVVASVDALSGAEPIIHSNCYVLKLHGDYKDSRILNTEEELSGYPKEYGQILERIFDEHGLIVCGWSGAWDLALREAILRTKNRRYSMFWASRGKPVDEAEALIRSRGAVVTQIADANKFFSTLQQRVETLRQTHRKNPQSIQLAVASIKRFLAKSEYRIQLEDLLTEYAEGLIEQLNTDEFSPQRQWSKTEFRNRVKAYEAASESLACMAGVLGRWGTGSDLKLTLDLVRDLYVHSERVQGGLNFWLYLRSYPVIVIITAYALGLLRAERWDVLHAFFCSVINRVDREPKRIVDHLFLNAWEGSDKNLWQNIEGFERRKTPLNDHLFDIFSEWGKSFLGTILNLDTLFCSFELLGSLVYFEQYEASYVESSLADPHRRYSVWMPIGRFGWNSSTRDRILRDIKSGDFREKILASGFARGDMKLLDLFVTNALHFSERMAWS